MVYHSSHTLIQLYRVTMSDSLSAKEAVQSSPELKELVVEILEWMVDNDYECGPHGSQIYSKLSSLHDE